MTRARAGRSRRLPLVLAGLVLGLGCRGKGEPASAERKQPSPSVEDRPTGVATDTGAEADPGEADAAEASASTDTAPAVDEDTDTGTEAEVQPEFDGPSPPLKLDRLAYLSHGDGPFPAMADDGPRLVMRVILGGEEDVDFADLPDTDEEPPVDEYGDPLPQTLDAPTARKLGIPAVKQAWMFGPAGPCAAKLGEPYVYSYAEGAAVVELGYEITACTKDFAPVVHLGADPPHARWLPVGAAKTTPVADPKTWKHEQRAAFEAIGIFDWTPNEDEKREPNYHARLRRAGPAVLELAYAHHWPGAECVEYEEIEVHIGLEREGKFVALPSPGEHVSDAELVGALIVADAPVAVVARYAFQMYVADVQAKKARWREIITGGYHEEDTAFSGWSVLEHYCGP